MRVSGGLWSIADGSLVAIAIELWGYHPLASSFLLGLEPSYGCCSLQVWQQCHSAPRLWGTSPRGPTALDECICISREGTMAMTSSVLGEGVGNIMTHRSSFTCSANLSGCVEGLLVGTV